MTGEGSRYSSSFGVFSRLGLAGGPRELDLLISLGCRGSSSDPCRTGGDMILVTSYSLTASCVAAPRNGGLGGGGLS